MFLYVMHGGDDIRDADSFAESMKQDHWISWIGRPSQQTAPLDDLSIVV